MIPPQAVAAVARFVSVVAALSDVCRDQRYWSLEARDVLAAAWELERLTTENATLREDNLILCEALAERLAAQTLGLP